MQVQVVTGRSEWVEALDQMGAHDYAHTFDFHVASQLNGEGTPVAFVGRPKSGEAVVFWPALQRPIAGSGLCDFTSVYGYAGPLLRGNTNPDGVFPHIFEAMRACGGVSLFSRMHPLFVEQIADETSRGHRLGDVVVIEVREGGDVISEYRGSHRREIAKALEQGLKSNVEEGEDALRIFEGIYLQAMRDIGADPYYRFSKDFFEIVTQSEEFRTTIISARLGTTPIAASMFIVTGQIMQYYLSGTVSEFRKMAPSKAIIARAHMMARDLGVNWIILGGGVGSKLDPLFKFKAGFSEVSKPFYIYKKVLDGSVYDDLCSHRNASRDSTYFPAYRT